MTEGFLIQRWADRSPWKVRPGERNWKENIVLSQTTTTFHHQQPSGWWLLQDDISLDFVLCVNELHSRLVVAVFIPERRNPLVVIAASSISPSSLLRSGGRQFVACTRVVAQQFWSKKWTTNMQLPPSHNMKGYPTRLKPLDASTLHRPTEFVRNDLIFSLWRRPHRCYTINPSEFWQDANVIWFQV